MMMALVSKAGTHDNPPIARQFQDSVLASPRVYTDELLQPFAYKETDVFEYTADSMHLVLENGYASPKLVNPGVYTYNASKYRVKAVDIVYTKYPLKKKDWRTHYHDLLAWRLQALFELDAALNHKGVQWRRVLQTAGKNEPAASQLFHGIVVYLTPLDDKVIDDQTPEEGSRPEPIIQNQGFLFRETQNPDRFRSRIIFTPDPDREPRRNMDPKDLKCPRWR